MKKIKNSVTDVISSDGFVEIYTLYKDYDNFFLIYLV
jgi:hypothetical protein